MDSISWPQDGAASWIPAITHWSAGKERVPSRRVPDDVSGGHLPEAGLGCGRDGGAQEEVEWLRRTAVGDLEAFGRFYDRSAPVLHALALRILGDAEEAEEVLQDAMAIIWERASQYTPQLGRPMGWAITIVRHRCIDRIRSTQRKRKWMDQLALEAEVNAGCDSVVVSKEVEGMEANALVHEALVGLPREQRQAIEMAFFGGLTQAEIAAHLQQPVGTIKARIRRGMMTLRDSLEGRL